MIDAIKADADGMLTLPALLAQLGGWAPQRRAYEAGAASADGWVDLPARGERRFLRPWELQKRAPGQTSQWGVVWQGLGTAQPADALATLGAFTRGAPLSLLSTRYKSPAKEWAEQVKSEDEAQNRAPCFSPNEDNVNLGVLEGQDQASRDGRWLLVFMWCAKAAALAGGRMIQLRIPGLGLSPMQVAEEEIARDCGLRIERRVLDAAVGKTLDPPLAASDPLLQDGGAQHAELADWVAQLTPGDAPTAEAAAGALATLAIEADNQVAIAQAGALPPLIALLGTGSAGAQEQAARALENLTFDAGNRAEAEKLGYSR
jgi:hypothetical protein